MNIREAIESLQTIQDSHGGNLTLVDTEGDIIKFQPTNSTAFPMPVVIVTFMDDELWEWEDGQ